MALNPAATNLAVSAYLAWLESEDIKRIQQVQVFREYYDGDPPTAMTDRQATYLNVDRDKKFGINICGVVVDTTVERLQVTGFDVAAPPSLPGEDVPEPIPGQTAPEDVLSSVLDRWWQVNRMDAVQDHVHRAALRDAEAFVVVGYDAEKEAPTLSYDFAYDGTSGVKVHRKPGTYNTLAYASKRWIEGTKDTKQRLNLYFPDRIEKWVRDKREGETYTELGWRPYDDPNDTTLKRVMLTDPDGGTYEASVAWWTETGEQDGKPLGVPIIPFVNRDDGTGLGKSEIDDALPIQDGINKIVLDLLGAADMAGFQMLWYTGEIPEGGWKVHPGAALPVKSGEDGKAQVGRIEAGDMSGLIAVLNSLVAMASGITGTPQSRFTPAAVRPAEGTQRQEEAALVAKVRGLQKSFGNAWEDAMRMALKVTRAFGKADIPDAEALLLSASWSDAEVRNERDHVEAVALKVEKLGVPVKQAWREIEYSGDQIREFEEIKAQQRAEAIEEETVKSQSKNADALALIGRSMLQGAANNGGRNKPGPGPALAPCIF